MKSRMITFLTALSLSFAAFAQNSIQVEVHNVVALDEQFSITFIIEGDSPSEFNWECPSDFDLVWGPSKGSSSSISIINGKRTSSKQVTYSYILMPRNAGKFTIPAAKAVVKGNEIASVPVGVEVVSYGSSQSSSGSQSQSAADPWQSQGQNQSQSQQSQSQSSGQMSNDRAASDDLFLRLILDKTNVVVGQPVTATIKLYKLYRKVDVAGFENADFPSFNGFWSQEIESPTSIQFTRENYNGQLYDSAVLRKYLLIPQQAGKLNIDPAELVCLVNVRTSSRTGSIFDSFFDDYTTIRKRARSKACTVNVSQLPAGAPASFCGGVGKFNISAKLTRDSLRMHEANSLIITVTGQGNVSLLSAPVVKLPHDMEVYDTKLTDKSSKGSLSGSKQYEYPFIPRAYGDFTIDPISYSYYDVDAGKYVTVKTKTLTFHVEKANDIQGSGTMVSAVQQNEVRNLGSDIRFIFSKLPYLQPKGHFFVGSVLFYIITALILLAAFVCWLLFRRIAFRRADIVGSRKRKATKNAYKRLRLARTYLDKEIYSAFYDELHEALLGYISDKLNMPVSELNKENISMKLIEGGVKEEAVNEFVGLIDRCEFARYSPSGDSADMKTNFDQAAELISEIDSSMKTASRRSPAMLVIALLLSATFSFNLQAQTSVDLPAECWERANASYSEGKWEDAVSAYEMILSTGLESAELYYNLGNAQYKCGSLSRAILNYERALKIDPSFEDARYNLEFVNSQTLDRIESVPEFILKTWTKKLCYQLDSDAWTVIFLVLLAISAAMLLLFLLASSLAGKRTGFIISIIALLLSLFALSFAIYQKSDYSLRDDAIVMKPVISVKSSPSDESGMDLFIIHEGTKVKVLDNVGDWVNVEIADGRQGWAKSSELEVV